MRDALASGLLLFLLVWSQPAVLAQEPKLAPADIEFTKKVVAKYHLMARVVLETQKDQFTRYQYDHYPEVERIKTEDGVSYARPQNKTWLKSDDWGQTGAPIADDLAQELDTFAQVVNTVFAQPKSHDATQGGTAWKYISQSHDTIFTYYTYERTREKPRPDGVYPQFTFMKGARDTDGQLLLSKATGQLLNGDEVIPFTISFDYFFPLPANTIIKVVPPPADKNTAPQPAPNH